MKFKYLRCNVTYINDVDRKPKYFNTYVEKFNSH